ncbi:hypothetical protein [Thermosulfuriphilus sp.]
MGRALATLGKYIHKDHQTSNKKACAKVLGRMSEGFWFLTSLILFIALGPFALIPTFIALMNLSNGEVE